jgi:hypothetical protein
MGKAIGIQKAHSYFYLFPIFNNRSIQRVDD